MIVESATAPPVETPGARDIAHAPVATPAGARVLVVDDSEDNRDLLSRLLGRWGHRVVTAACGEDAMALVQGHAFDLVLLDVMMPGIDGIETCRRMRAQLEQRALPIIIATALTDRDSRRRAKDAGADDFLSKPIDAVELEARVRNLLAAKAYHDLRERQHEQIALELQRTRSQLLRVDRLATAGTLAAGTGHELNNISTVLLGLCELIDEHRLYGEPAGTDEVAQLRRASAHVVEHARQLLAFGRSGSEQIAEVDLRVVIHDTVAMLKTSGRTRHVSVRVALPDEPATVLVDRTRIEQVLVNLVANAADALAETCEDPTVWVTCVGPDDEGLVRCFVEDNGPGVPPSRWDTVFEPYYTTKPPGQGTGLGLPVVRQILREYAGSVTLGARVGGGASFTIALPAAKRGSVASHPDPHS